MTHTEDAGRRKCRGWQIQFVVRGMWDQMRPGDKRTDEQDV